MSFEFDSSEVEPDKIGQGAAPFASKSGRAHLLLTDFDEYGDTKNGRHILKWEIVAHDQDDQVALVVWDYLSDPSPNHKDGGETARHILCERATALGLLNQELIRKLKSEGKKIGFDLNNGVHKQVFANLIAEEYKGEKRIKVRSTYHVDDPKAAKFPRNEGMLARAKRGGKPAEQPAGDNGSPAATEQPQAVEAVSSDDPFADMV